VNRRPAGAVGTMTTSDPVDPAVAGGVTTPTTATAITLTGVTHRFALSGGPTTVLEGIDLHVDPGEFVVLLGPSGSGKTTLLRIISGLVAPSQGQVRLVPPGAEQGEPTVATGEDPCRSRSGRRQEIGFVFQEPNLMPWRNARRNVELPLEVQKVPKTERTAVANQLLELVGLERFADAYPRQLSGGMRQRVALARALAPDPGVLLMDEPFGALDAQTRDMMNTELQRLWIERKKTVVFVTHSIPEAVFLADRIVLLSAHPGRVASITSVDFTRPRALSLLDQPEFGRIVGLLRSQLEV
jgi:NitT/TauT family transport system ATP-binding protein